jgi:hypothetical protein
MVRQIAIELETPGDSRTMFRLRIDASLIAEDLTAAQAHVLIGEILERITLPKSSAGASPTTESDATMRAPAPSPPLAAMARRREQMRCPVHQFPRERTPAGGLPTIGLVRARRDPTARLLRGGVWTRWTSVRKVKEGETTNDLFAFLTTEANAVVAPIHVKAMPVILTTPEEIDLWMTAPAKVALTLQRPLPDDALRIVARGQKQDGLPDDQPFISA